MGGDSDTVWLHRPSPGLAEGRPVHWCAHPGRVDLGAMPRVHPGHTQHCRAGSNNPKMTISHHRRKDVVNLCNSKEIHLPSLGCEAWLDGHAMPCLEMLDYYGVLNFSVS